MKYEVNQTQQPVCCLRYRRFKTSLFRSAIPTPIADRFISRQENGRQRDSTP
jgi:hypothetical protein